MEERRRGRNAQRSILRLSNRSINRDQFVIGRIKIHVNAVSRSVFRCRVHFRLYTDDVGESGYGHEPSEEGQE